MLRADGLTEKTRQPDRHQLSSIQLLRALAAGMVVFGHLLGAARSDPGLFGPAPPIAFAGGVGVDVFFLISGFIMVYASDRMFGHVRGSGIFLAKRLIRIVPLYWATTMFVMFLALIGHNPLPSAEAIVASLAFIPYDTLGMHDGFAFPIVDLGWTLNYELLFYAIFAACIPLGRGRCVVAVTIVMLLLVLAGLSFHPTSIQLRFWTQPIILEFVAGMMIALAFIKGLVRAPLIVPHLSPQAL